MSGDEVLILASAVGFFLAIRPVRMLLRLLMTSVPDGLQAAASWGIAGFVAGCLPQLFAAKDFQLALTVGAVIAAVAATVVTLLRLISQTAAPATEEG